MGVKRNKYFNTTVRDLAEKAKKVLKENVLFLDIEKRKYSKKSKFYE